MSQHRTDFQSYPEMPSSSYIRSAQTLLTNLRTAMCVKFEVMFETIKMPESNPRVVPPNPNETNTSVPPQGNQTRPTAPDNNSAGDDLLMPSLEEIQLITREIDSNTVATKQTVTEILDLLKADHREADRSDLFQLAWFCYHNGSSRFLVARGETSHRVPLAKIKNVVELKCTLRQFCMYYAKTCYNTGKAQMIPPASWSTRGYPENAKFAAFDFFSGVTNNAVPTPAGGMAYYPTADEIASQSLNADLAIAGSRTNPHQYSTRGNMMGMQQVRARDPPPMITFGE
uniref:Coat protein n=1 Tax=Allexivirus sigmamedicagonis TaxID=1985968 RepID=A0A6C0W6P9_9VIRU|nr:coat protein [Alfalfa virus S]